MRSLGSIEQKLKPLVRSISTSPFVVAIVCGLLLKAADVVLGAGIVLGFVLVIAGAWILANYFFEIIEHRAGGDASWPVLSIETLFSVRRQLGPIFAAIVVGLLLFQYGLVAARLDALARLFGAVVMLVLPVSAAMLAVTRSPLRAIDPVKLIASAARMEMGYIIILIASFAVWLLANRAAASGSLLALLFASYACLLLGYVIGSVVYARRNVLGVRTRHAPEDKAAKDREALMRQRQAALTRAYGFASRGNIDGALGHVLSYAGTEPDALDAEIWLFQEMTLWHDPRAALELGRELPARLAGAGRERDASKVTAMTDFLAARMPGKQGAQRNG